MPSELLPRRYRWFLRLNTADEMWYRILTQGDPFAATFRRWHDLLPTDPRCASCHTPFGGLGGALARWRIYGSRRSTKNPQFCTACDFFNSRYPGGAEVELTMLFIDVRGSTRLAEGMDSTEFSRLMNRFYKAAMTVLVQADAFIDKLVGDEVTALFVPGYAGPEHARKAVRAGQRLLRAMGYGEPGGPWVPVGVGVHTGPAWVGAIVGASGDSADFTALGDNVNITARLASQAGAGEVLVSEAAYRAAHLKDEEVEWRDLSLKGKGELVGVRVLHAE